MDVSSSSLARAMAPIQSQAHELSALLAAHEKAALRGWAEEKEQLTALIASLNQSHDILKREKQRVKTELKAALSKASAAHKQSTSSKPSAAPSEGTPADVVDLQLKLVDLNNRMLDIDETLTTVAQELQSAPPLERELHSTRLVVMQDTRRILQNEIEALRTSIFHIESQQKYEAEKRSAEESGFAQLARLEDQLLKSTARLDKAKQQLYFPAAKGYRFSAGGSGVYLAAQDLSLSEVSGRFDISCERVTRPDGTRVARLSLAFSGASGTSDWAEARAAARANRSAGGMGVGSGAAGSGSVGGAGTAGMGGGTTPLTRRHTRNPSTASAGSTGGIGSFQAAPASGLSQQGSAPHPAPQSQGSHHPPSHNSNPGLHQHPNQHHHHHQQQQGPQQTRGHQRFPSTSSSIGASPTAAQGTGIARFGPGPVAEGVIDDPLGAGGADVTGDGTAGTAGAPVSITSEVPGLQLQGSGPGEALDRASASSHASSTIGPAGAGSAVQGSSTGAGVGMGAPGQIRPSGGGVHHMAQMFEAGMQGQHTVSPVPHNRQSGGGQQGQATAGSTSSTRHSGGGYTGVASGVPAVPGATSGLFGGLQQQGLPPLQPSQQKKGEGVANFLSGLSKKKDKLKNVIAGVGSGSLESEGSAGSAGSGFSLGQRMGKLKEGLGDRMDRVRDSMRENLNREALSERMGRVKEGMREITLEGVKESLNERIDRLQEGVKEGVQESKGKLNKFAKAISTKATGMVRGNSPEGRRLGRISGASDGSQGSAGGAASGHVLSSGRAGSGIGDLLDLGPESHQHYSGPEAVHPGAQQQGHHVDLLGGPPGSGQPSEALGATTAPPTAFASPAAAAAVATAAAGAHASTVHPAPSLQTSLSARSNISTGSQASMAPGETGPLSTASDVSAVQYPPAVPTNTEHQGLSRGSTGVPAMGGGGSGGVGDSGLSVVFEDLSDVRPSRKGVYVQVLGEKVEVVGERGTKVPDISMKELLIEVEVSMSCVVEWTLLDGWQIPESRPFEFAILQLDHRMRGNTIPLPRTALKSLLNMFLPGAISRAILSALPPELGQYIVESGEGMQVSGEFRIMGHALSTYMADIMPGPKSTDGSGAKRSVVQEQQAAGARARALLGLSELQAQALGELFSGRAALAEPPRPASICELCRMRVAYGNSKLWGTLCEVWDRALQVSFDYWRVPAVARFGFQAFMEGPVARLVRKPVRISFAIDKLRVALDVDAALNTLRSLFERLAVEFHKRSLRGDDDAGVPKEPLEVQLENLGLWHASLLTELRKFKARFRSASCTLVTAADAHVFQAGAENVTYDGPLRLRIPLELALDPDHSFVLPVKLPDKEQTAAGLATMVQEVMEGLAATVVTPTPAPTPATGPSGRPTGDSSGGAQPRAAGALLLQQQQQQQLLAATTEALAATLATRKATVSDGGGGDEASHGDPGVGPDGVLLVPALEDPVVGTLALRRLALSLRLDEERLSELLGTGATGGPGAGGSRVLPTPGAANGLVGMLMGCYGDLFSASLDVGWRPDAREEAEEGATRPACMLTVANNEVTRVSATLESLLFQSCVSPRLAVRVLNAVVTGLMVRFYPKDSYQVRFWQRLFTQLHEYLGRDTLDAFACVSARAELVRPRPGTASAGTASVPQNSGQGVQGQVQGQTQGGATPAQSLGRAGSGQQGQGQGSVSSSGTTGAGGGAATPQRTSLEAGTGKAQAAAGPPAGSQHASSKLRIVLMGSDAAVPSSNGLPSSSGLPGAASEFSSSTVGESERAASGAAAAALSAAPIYFVNEINLLTLLDSVKLLSGSQQ